MRPGRFRLGILLGVGLAIVLSIAGCRHFTGVPKRTGTIADLKKRAPVAANPDQIFHIHGTVTFADPLADFFVIQDETGGVRMTLPTGSAVAEPAQFAEVSGFFSDDGSQRVFRASDISRVRRQSLPPAIPVSRAGDLNRFVDRRVSLEGVVQSTSHVRPGLDELMLKMDNTRVRVNAVEQLAGDVQSLTGSKVHLTGVLLDPRAGDQKTCELWTSDLHAVAFPTPQATPAPVADTPAATNAVRTALQVHRAPVNAAAAHVQVDLKGIVTFSDPLANRLYVQDKTDAVSVEVKPGGAPPLHTGDLVRIRGVIDAGDFAPVVAKAAVEIIGVAPLPTPETDFEVASLGRLDSRWVSLRGVVQEARQTGSDVFVNLVWGEHRFKAHILAPLSEVRSLVDREVDVTGACGSIFNNRRQNLGLQLFVPGMRFIAARSAPVPDPFLLPIRSAADLLQFSDDSSFGHRAHIRGVVTFASPSGPTWIRDRTDGLMLATHNAPDLRDGDIVDVVGFPVAGDYGPVLNFAEIRKLRSGPPPAPIVTNAAEAAKGGAESQLIQLDGTLLGSFVHDGIRVLRLASGSDIFGARISEFARFPKLSAGSRLRLTGICSVRTDDPQGTLLARGFRLELRTADDVIVLQNGPWFTEQRFGLILMGTLVLAAAALFWVGLLRRNVRNQTRTLLSKSAQLEAANALAHQALAHARQTESLEQSRRSLLELVANDEPLERIMTEIARAAEKHSPTTICSLQVDLSDGSQVKAAPSLPDGSSADADVPPSSRRLHVPITVGGFRTGVMIMETREGTELNYVDRILFPTWAQFASLAIERRGLYETLSFRAQFDALTGLHNRASLYEKLSQELAAARRGDTLLAVLYLDLNGFKAVNDTYGHDAGDQILREVSGRIRKTVRRSDVVARLGGDEFVVVLTQLNAVEEAYSIASALRSTLSKPIDIDSHAVHCGGSLGLAIYPRDGDESDLLIKKADCKMYDEKSAGRLVSREDPIPIRV